MSFQQRMNLREGLTSNVTRKRPINDPLTLRGHWVSELWRKGKLISVHEAHNDIVVVGKNALLNTFFNALLQITPGSWCAGLVDANGFTGYNVATDTMSSHPGWVEFTGYSQTVRPAWGQGTAASASISNASPMVFDLTVTGTVQGLFITTVNTKGSTAGVLWSAASYTNPPACVPSDEIRSTYGLSC
jgi:hypothetical protein